ncbi:MAG TPA: hypothetical protein PLL33_14235 [Paracoccus sp. (in: a-proteobacteria)]|nr:hypothetical protein [Paracoccus sp. (in: a-proteobacteria)]
MRARLKDLRETEALFFAGGAVFCHERRWTTMARLPGTTDEVLQANPGQ